MKRIKTKHIKGKHIALSCLAIGGAIATCVTGDGWIFFWTAVVLGLNID